MDSPLPRNYKRKYDETLTGTSGTSSFPLASATTKRRKTQRRLAQMSREAEEMRVVRSNFQHIQVLGRAPAYSKLNPELVIAPPDPIIEQFSLINPPPIDNFKPEQYTFVKACTPVEMAHLKNFDRPPHTPDAKHNPAIEMAASLVADILDLPQYLLFPEKHDLIDVKFWPKKFAGIEYATMGLKTRAEAEPIAQRDAEVAFEALLAGEHVPPHDVRLGGRGKIAHTPAAVAASNPPAVGRLILMLSHRDLKLCGVTENQLTKAYCPAKYPIAVGQSWYHRGSTEFINRIGKYDAWFCFDAKKFDSNINPWMVRLAINIVRQQYMQGDHVKYDAYWEFVYESLVEAPIYRDDGVRFKKSVGTTSGHSHNTLLQSIITLIIAYGCVIILHPDVTMEELREDVWVESLGDDNLLCLKGRFTNHTVEEIAQVAMDVFRIDWFGKKSFSTTRLLDPGPGDFQGVQFLGKFWYLGDYPTETTAIKVPIPYRPAEETYLRLLYPEYGTLEKSQTYLRVLGNYIDAAGNRAMEKWLQDLMDWMDVDEADVPTEWPSNFKRMISRDYSNVGVEVPAPQRIGFEQWRDLVLLSREDYRARWPNQKGHRM